MGETALQTAMELDIDPESDAVKQAKQTLGQMEANQTLSTAIASRDEQQLKHAIEHACAVGVVKAKLDKAEQRLTRLMALTTLTACRSHTVDVKRAVSC